MGYKEFKMDAGYVYQNGRLEWKALFHLHQDEIINI